MQIVSFEASTMLGTRPDRPETSQRSLTFFGVPSHFGQAGAAVIGIQPFKPPMTLGIVQTVYQRTKNPADTLRSLRGCLVVVRLG
jgi:hypothetical protein